jgi:tetratricopeptide (TPR) repeat protein
MRSIRRPTNHSNSPMPLPTSLNRPALLVLGLAALSVAACGGAQSRMAKHMGKGQAFLAAGNFEKARVEFQNALQIVPTDAQARYENGVVDEKLGKTRDAAQFYQGAIDVNPDHVAARANLARLYLFAGAPERALDLIKPALEKHPDDAELLTVRAAARLQQKDLSGAQADAERAVQLAPTNEDAVAVLAGLYTSAGANDKAQTLLEQSIQKMPETIDLRLALAQVYSQENRVADSEGLLIKLVELRPTEQAHRLRLAQYYVRLNQIDAAESTLRRAVKDLPADHDLKLALVDFLAARRNREAAEKELKQMIAAAPDDNELKFALARFYEGGHQSAQAETIYQEVIKKEGLDSDGLSARNRLATLRAQRGDVAGALALANEVLAKSPRDDDALLMRGDIALAKQDPRSAIVDLRAVLRDQPNSVGVLRILARAHLANGEPAVAEETLRHAVEANPKDFALRLDFAELLVRLNKPEQAKPILKEFLSQQPGNVPALDAQFRVSLATNDLAAAKAAAENIVAARPKAAIGYFYEGMTAEADKRPDDALRLYAAAVDAEPTAMEPLQAQMRLLLAAKRVDEAFKRADELSSRYPASPLGPEAKGELLLTKGRNAEAQSAFNDAIARAPKWWPPYHGLAAVQMAAKNPDAAIEILGKAKSVVQQPDRLEIELAALLEATAKHDQAITEYEAVLARNPQSEVAMNNLAMLLATYKKDRASLDRAKELSARFADSVNPSYLDTYGWVLYKRGEAAASVPVLERAVEKSPDEPIARYHLGMAQSQLGSSSEARDNLLRAVNSGAKFTGLDEAKATLDKIATLPESASASPKT